MVFGNFELNFFHVLVIVDLIDDFVISLGFKSWLINYFFSDLAT